MDQATSMKKGLIFLLYSISMINTCPPGLFLVPAEKTGQIGCLPFFTAEVKSSFQENSHGEEELFD